MIAKLVDWFVGTIKDFDRSMFSLSAGLGPWITPVAPALVYGHTFYAGTTDELGPWAVIGGVAMACGLVVAGATSSHTAMALKSAGAPADKVRGCWVLVIAYVVLEIGGILTMNKFNGLEVVGVTASLLTLVVYLSRSYRNYLDDFKAQAVEAKNEKSTENKLKLDFQIEQARLDAEARRQQEAEKARLIHEEKLAKIEAKKQKDIVSASVPKVSQASVPKVSQGKTLETLKAEIIAELSQEKPNMTQLARRLDIGRGTLYRHLGTLAETGEIIKNGNGYEIRN